jgi:hypothetical protein
MQNVAITSRRSSRKFILIAGLLLYCGAFAFLLSNKSFDVFGAGFVFVVFGIVLPLIAWIATRRAVPLSISIQSQASELIVLSGYIIALSLYLIGRPQWIDQHLPSSWIDSARIKFFITLAKKLVVFIAIPFAIFRFGLAIGFAISGFSGKVCGHCAGVIYLSSLSWAERSLPFNISLAAAALRFGANNLPCFNCFLVYRFALSGFRSRRD